MFSILGLFAFGNLLPTWSIRSIDLSYFVGLRQVFSSTTQEPFLSMRVLIAMSGGPDHCDLGEPVDDSWSRAASWRTDAVQHHRDLAP
jgi:hypothetical protein